MSIRPSRLSLDNGKQPFGFPNPVFSFSTCLLYTSRELHRILDEVSECTVLASDYFQILGIPKDFSYAVQGEKRVEKWDSNDIQMQHLRFHYAEEPDKPILEDLNLQVGAGKFIGIAGPSGCGKSTVRKAIDKLEETEGTITIGGYDLSLIHISGTGCERGNLQRCVAAFSSERWTPTACDVPNAALDSSGTDAVVPFWSSIRYRAAGRADRLQPVSYTHLDVYKRQPKGCLLL